MTARAGCAPPTQLSSFQFVEATIEDVHAAIQSGAMSCTDIVAGYLQRIEVYDKPSGLNAIIFTNPRALEKAQQIDERLAAGDDLGELFCVPILLKDNFDTSDMPTTAVRLIKSPLRRKSATRLKVAHELLADALAELAS